jgi:hypothetical protein
VISVLYKVALEQVFCSEYFGSPLSYQSTKAPYYINTLLLTEGQKAMPRNLPKGNAVPEIVEF